MRKVSKQESYSVRIDRFRLEGVSELGLFRVDQSPLQFVGEGTL